MTVSFDFDGRVSMVTGAAGTLGGAVARSFADAGATVVGVDVAPETEADLPAGAHYHRTDLTDEPAVTELVDDVVDDHGRIDHLLAVAGTWRGGDPIHETDVETFDTLVDVNCKTLFLAAKHTLPHLRETGGALVGVSSRSSLEGGTGDGPYRASKAAVRLLIETIAAENLGTVNANAVMPSVIDTPMNREMMPDADFDEWVDAADIARVMAFLCTEESEVTSGAAVPVYGEA